MFKDSYVYNMKQHSKLSSTVIIYVPQVLKIILKLITIFFILYLFDSDNVTSNTIHCPHVNARYWYYWTRVAAI